MIFVCACGAKLVESGALLRCRRCKGHSAPTARIRAAGVMLGLGVGDIRIPVIWVKRAIDHKHGWQVGSGLDSFAWVLDDEPIQLHGVSPIDFEVG